MRFVRENHQMANKKLYREDVLQMLFTDSDSEGEYLPFGNDDRLSNDRASPGTSLQLVPPRKARVFTKQVKQVIILTLCPMGMGVAGVNVVVVSIGELLRSERHWLRGADDRPDCVVCSDRSRSNHVFTPQAARASKCPEVINFQCEPAASSGESGVARFGW